MPRANRFFLPGHVWHLTHRCHKREFLLKFDKDRRAWIMNLFEARKRYGLVIYNYMVTSNHIHLLVRSDDKETVPKAMKYVAGRTAQDYNIRKKRKGAYWDDRYHATAVETGEHFLKCMLYIDMNMVRAGVVRHPSEWRDCGFKEVLTPKQKYAIINHEALLSALRLPDQEELRKRYPGWLDEVLKNDRAKFEAKWSSSIAVGSKSFVDDLRMQLGLDAQHRKVSETDDGHHLHEPESPYDESNLIPWDVEH